MPTFSALSFEFWDIDIDFRTGIECYDKLSSPLFHFPPFSYSSYFSFFTKLKFLFSGPRTWTHHFLCQPWPSTWPYSGNSGDDNQREDAGWLGGLEGGSRLDRFHLIIPEIRILSSRNQVSEFHLIVVGMFGSRTSWSSGRYISTFRFPNDSLPDEVLPSPRTKKWKSRATLSRYSDRVGRYWFQRMETTWGVRLINSSF